MTSTGDDSKPKLSQRELNSRPLPRRFYAQVSVGKFEPTGVGILLDTRPARTPKLGELRLPTLALARAIAGEWAAQNERVDPARMPLTRLANTAIDGVRGREADVAADVVKYAGSDLVCYRAERPAGLVRRQAEIWDPLISWAGSALGARFTAVTGVVHVPQPPASLAALAADVKDLDAFELTALHTMTTLTGSAMLALGVRHRVLSVEAAWSAAHIDEDWQIAQWGEDGEAAARRQQRWIEMATAARLLSLLATKRDPA